MRINFNNPSNPQESRIAGADHSVSKSARDTIGLKLTKAGGFVIVEGAKYPLSKEDANALRLGVTVEVAEEYRISLSSNARDRSSALLIVQSAKSTDNALLGIVGLKLAEVVP